MSDSTPSTDLFPSGPWTGFFLDPRAPGRHQMEFRLAFANGRMTGDGRDRVGQFTIDGVYDDASGKCSFTKQYIGQHAVHYTGFNEGKGIWGTWLLSGIRGGFHIWPEGMADPTVEHLSEEVDEPIEVGSATTQQQPQPVGG